MSEECKLKAKIQNIKNIDVKAVKLPVLSKKAQRETFLCGKEYEN